MSETINAATSTPTEYGASRHVLNGTPSGHSFELHFYRDLVDNIFTGRDFKVVFKEYFQ